MPSKTPALLSLLLALQLGGVLPAYSRLDTNFVYLIRAENVLQAALQNQAADTNSLEAAWQAGKAAFAVAELSTNETQCATLAQLGITASRKAVKLRTNSAPAHYYLAANLGKLAEAQAPSLAAYRLVHEVEQEFQRAAELDVRFDHAGPARTLGELYFQAPGWPLSIGSKSKAREWLENAASLAPDFPENQLNLAEARLKWHQREEAKASFQKMEAIWPAARTNLNSQEWEYSWLEWESRRAKLRAEFHHVYGVEP